MNQYEYIDATATFTIQLFYYLILILDDDNICLDENTKTVIIGILRILTLATIV